jgi:hypothetical protein
MLPAAEDMVELLQEHGSAAAVAVDTWLSLVRPAPSTLTVVLSALREARALNDTIVATFSGLRRGWTKDERLEFLRAHVVDPNAAPLGPDEVECVGLRDASPGDITELIVDRFVECRNNAQRKAVVSLMGAAGITDGPARRRLIETVVIPLLTPPSGEPQVGMTEIGLDALHQLGAPLPHGVKKTLGEAVRQAVAGSDALESKAVKVLGPLGYPIERSGWFLQRKSVKYSG